MAPGPSPLAEPVEEQERSIVPKHHRPAEPAGPTPETAADAPLGQVGAAILRQQYDRLWAAEPEARDGQDAEAVHHMRVATRRLRAALRLFVPDEARASFAPLEAALRAVAGSLGAVRDLDVLGDHLRAYAAGHPADAPAIEVLLTALRAVRADRQTSLRALLDAPATQQFRDDFPSAVETLKQTAARRPIVGRAAPKLVHRRARQVLRALDEIPAPTSAELHRVRIRSKRLRYAVEFFRPWLGQPGEALIALATQLQDTLGSLHDSDVAAESLHALVAAVPTGTDAGSANGPPLAQAALGFVQDRQQQRDELLIQFRAPWAELRAFLFE
jgi:CHAD domain-containing protein